MTGQTALSGVTVSSGILTTVANTLSADQVSGTFQHLAPGWVTLATKSSATGVQAQLVVGGIPLINLQTIPFTGTAGSITTKDNIMAHVYTKGGRVELKFNNTTAGTPTVEWILAWSPTG